MTDCDIICLSISRWDAAISSPSLSLAKEWSKTNRVFYIDHPYSIKDYILERKTKPVKNRREALVFGRNVYSKPASLNGITIVTPPLMIPVNFLPSGVVYDVLSSINNKRVSTVIRKIIRDFKISNYLFINFFDPFYSPVFDIPPQLNIYHCMDDISQESYTQKHGVELEQMLVAKSDLTLCTSRELTRKCLQYSNNVVYFPNGADTALFGSALNLELERPMEFGQISGKIVGFTGSIEYRTDFDLLRMLASNHPDKVFYLLGPVITKEHLEKGLDAFKNIVFAGARHISELPAYLKQFDCVIIPYKKNQLTKSIYPLKINEYLAAGKPVVSTRFSEDIESFTEVIYLAENPEEFSLFIDKAIEDDSEENIARRVQVASNNSWTIRVQEFWKLIIQVAEQQGSAKR